MSCKHLPSRQRSGYVDVVPLSYNTPLLVKKSILQQVQGISLTTSNTRLYLLCTIFHLERDVVNTITHTCIYKRRTHNIYTHTQVSDIYQTWDPCIFVI